MPPAGFDFPQPDGRGGIRADPARLSFGRRLRDRAVGASPGLCLSNDLEGGLQRLIEVVVAALVEVEVREIEIRLKLLRLGGDPRPEHVLGRASPLRKRRRHPCQQHGDGHNQPRDHRPILNRVIEQFVIG